MPTDLVLGDTTIEVHADRLVLKGGGDAEATIVLRIDQGNLILGGEGEDGDLLLHDRAGNLTIGLNGESGSLHLGGTSEDGDIVVYDREGKQTAHIDGSDGSIEVEGEVRSASDFVSSGRFRTVSDSRLKTGLAPIDGALGLVNCLTGLRYRMVDTPDEERLGFAAQDVAKHIPQAVSSDERGILSLDMQAIVPVLLEAVKQLSREVEELRTRHNA